MMDPSEVWLSRQELADRYKVPPKTPADWASRGLGPKYALIGKHARYRLSDVIAWEATQLRDPADRLADGVYAEQGAAV